MKKFFTLRSLRSLSLALFVGLIGFVETAKAQIYFNDFGTGAGITTKPYTGTPSTFAPNLNTSSWTTSAAAFGGFAGNGGGTSQSLSLSSSAGTPTFTLTFNVASGYQLSVTSFNFWRIRSASGAQNWSMTINGTAVGSGTIPTTAASIGTTTVSNAISGLTGTITVVFTMSGASGAGTARLDDFTLNGAVTSTGGTTLSASALTAFGNQCINGGPYGPNSFTITGSSLTTANVTVGALNGFSYSTTSGGTYTSSLSLTQPGGSYSQPIFVDFDPTAVASYSGNIAVGGGGASSINVAASGSGVNTAPTVTTGAASAITTSSATVAGTLVAGCGAITAYGIEYSTTPGFANGAGTPVASTNLSGTAFSSALSGLNPCTAYYTHAYATRAAGTTYGTQGTFTTAAIAAPTATAGTAVTDIDFMANWGAVAGAIGYRLDVYTLSPLVPEDFTDGDFTSIPTWTGSTGEYSILTASTLPGGTAPTDGSYMGSNSTTGSSALLMPSTETGQWKFSWGSPTFNPANTNAIGVILMSDASVTSIGGSFNGYYLNLGASGTNDAIELWKSTGTSKTKIGDFPSSPIFGTGGLANGLDIRVTRNGSGQFQLYYATGFTYAATPTTSAGTLTDNTYSTSSYFGLYTDLQNPASSRRIFLDNIALGGSEVFVSGYNNFDASTSTSAAVTGLDALTTYYYRVRTVGPSCTSVNSNVITVVTTAGASPLLTAGTLADFGTLCQNSESAAQSVTVDGFNLTTADVTVAALPGFSYSTTELGTYTATLSIPHAAGAFSQDIWVKFTPTAVQNYDGDITIGGGGAPDITVAVTGTGINTAPSLTTGAASAITTFSATVAGQITDAGCGTITAYGIEYSTTMGFTPGTGTQEPSTNLSGSAYSSDLAGLSPCTPYYYVAYATRASGTTFGAEQTFTTATISAPVAAAGTAVGTDAFTANWGTVSGATDYRLDVYTQTTTLATDLFISEYVEGSSNNKYIEIFNGTGAPVSLSDYELRLFNNGAGSPSNTAALTGTLANNTTKVYRNASATIYGGTTTSSTAVGFNGNDAIALYKVSTSSYVDILGEIGTDPGSAWTDGGLSTLNTTLVRKANVSGGVTTNPTGLGFPTLASEWDGHSEDDVSRLGSHTFNSVTQIFVPGYNDLSVAGTSEVVTGLDPGTTYYYAVRAESGTCTSANSDEIEVTTVGFGCTDPLADNYDANAAPDNGTCTYCAPTFTYDTPTPTPITVGTGIPDQHMAVAEDCHDFKIAMNAYERYVPGGIVPTGNVYTTTTGYSPTSPTDPTPDVNNARWNFLVSVDLGTYDFTQLAVYMDMDFDPGATPVYQTVDISALAAAQGQQNSHVQQQAQNMKSAFWSLLFPGVSFDATVPGTYDLRIRVASPLTGAELISHAIQVVVAEPAGCTDPLADNYNSGAITDDGSCTYCVPTITYNAPTPTPIVIGTGIPDQNMAVSQDCRSIDVALNAYERYGPAIIPAGNVYTTTTGNSPTSQGDPTPDPVLARWNILGSVDLGSFDFTQVDVLLDLDFDPGATPVWNTVNLSQAMIDNSMGAQHVYQASENLASPFWTIAFPGVTFDPSVPGTYDVRVRLESVQSGEELVNMAIQVVVEEPLGCTDPLADNYNSSATTDDGSCTYCVPTITYNAPTPTPIVIGTGIPDQNMAVSQDCRSIDVALNAYERYVGAIIPSGNVYTTTTGNSPISQGDPTPDPVLARWNILGSVDLGSFDFTQVNVFLDLDFDPGATPVWNTVNLSQAMIDNSMGAQHVYQASENLASPFWTIAFPGVTFDPQVAGIYDVRVRLESVHSGEELVNMAIQVVVEEPLGCTDPLADNYNSSATTDDGSCTYCVPTITYNAPTPTPIVIGTGIPDQNMAVSQDCRSIDVALNAYERYVGAIIPSGNVYTTTTGNSPTSQGDPTPDPVLARWNILGSVDLGSFDFTQVNVFLDLDFDPGATPVWNTVNLSQGMIDNSMGGLHVYQASENLASPFWTIAFPGVTFDPSVPGIYDVRVRLESVYSGEELVNLAIQVVVEEPEVTYYSQQTGNVSDPIWDVVPVGTAGPAVFGTNANMVIQDTHTVTNTADVDVKDLTVEAGGTLALATATSLTANGDEVTFDGTVTAADNSTLALAGTGTSILESTGGPLNLWNLTVNTPQGTLTDATLSIRGTLQLDGGDFDATLGTVTLASDISGTGRLGTLATGASYTGNMTVQRYIPAGRTNWRMLGSPVAGRTVSNWQDDFFTAGYPGSAYPNFYSPVGSGILWPSIRWYDETRPVASADTGIVGVTSNTQALTPGQGFFAWSGDNLTTTTAFTLDVTGAPNVATTPITLPMTYTDSGNPSADGWNLVSNPVPSPIAFDGLSLGSDVLPQYAVFNPVNGTSQSYSGGIGQGNVNGTIQSSQGFWLQATGSDVTTTVSEAAKVDEHSGGVFGGSQQAVRPIVRLFVSSTINTYSDEATLVFDQGTPDHDAIDARKMPFRTIGAPLISARTPEGENLAIDFFGAYTSAITIPVTVEVGVTGTYTISAGITGMNNLSCLTLEDVSTGTITPLTDGATYSFAINANDDANTPRFLLHGTAPLPFYAQDATCANAPNGLAAVMIDNGPVDVTWTDAFGTIVATITGVSNGLALNDELAAGSYTVRVSPIGACGEVTTDFSIDAPPAIIGSVIASTPSSCPNSTDGSVTVEAIGGTGELAYSWNDGTLGNTFTGAAGAYQVTITDANSCATTETWTVAAGEGAIADFTNGPAVEDQPVAFTNTSSSSTAWTWEFGDGNSSTDMDPVHTYTDAGTYTVTLTATDGNCTDIISQQVVVDISTGITSVAGSITLNVYATQQQLVIDHPFGNAPVDVAVYDATGRLAMSRDAVVKPEQITLSDRTLNTGVWFVRVKSGDVERTFRVPLIR